jgi:uncharacterized cupin superfamily protein
MIQQSNIKSFSGIEPVLRESPQGKFKIIRRNLSEALGAVKDSGPWNGGPPFDVEHVTLPAGKRNFPFHSHQAVWEFYWILSGEGFVRINDARLPIKGGEFFNCPPGCAHQIEATSEMTYAVIANNVQADIGYYPDSKKWITMPERTCFRESVDYYDGEEEQSPK